MPFVHVNNIKLFYQSVGVGPSLVFIHGGYGGASSSVLPREQAWVNDLKEEYNVITYDRRSSGRSSYPESEHSIDIFVDDLKGLIDKLSITKLFLIGSSAGGPIALKYGLRYSDSLDGLILANTSARIWNHDGRVTHLEELRRRHDLLQRIGPEATFDLLNVDNESKPFYLLDQKPNPRPSGTLHQFAAREAKIRELKDSLTRPERIRYYVGELLNLAAYIDFDITELLKDIEVPTLVIHGDADTQVPYQLGSEMSCRIKGSRFYTVSGAGHGIMQWDNAVSQIKFFCDELKF